MFVLFCAGFDVTLFSEWTGVTERERERERERECLYVSLCAFICMDIREGQRWCWSLVQYFVYVMLEVFMSVLL